jgi:hypothetical protein
MAGRLRARRTGHWTRCSGSDPAGTLTAASTGAEPYSSPEPSAALSCSLRRVWGGGGRRCAGALAGGARVDDGVLVEAIRHKSMSARLLDAVLLTATFAVDRHVRRRLIGVASTPYRAAPLEAERQYAHLRHVGARQRRYCWLEDYRLEGRRARDEVGGIVLEDEECFCAMGASEHGRRLQQARGCLCSTPMYTGR